MVLPPRTPDLVSLDLLLSLAATGSIGGAARRHGLSQPAVSMRMRALEQRLGLRLLERSSTGSSLTTDGVAMAEWARAVVEGARSFIAAADALRVTENLELKLAASKTVAEYLMPRWLGRFHEDRPKLAVALRMGNSEEVAEMVSSRDVDLGFVEGEYPPQGLISRVVGGDELAVVVAPDHPWAIRKRPISPQELASSQLILREPRSGTRQVLESRLAALSLRPVPLLQLESTTAIKEAVAQGQGPSVLSRLAVTRELEEGRLVEVEVSGLSLRRNFRAVWRGQPPRPLAQRFLRAILAEDHQMGGPLSGA